MKDFRANYPGRGMQTFWTTGLKEVQGFSCGPGNEGYFWVPEERSSQCVGTSIFTNREDARARGVADLERQIREATYALEQLKAKR